MKLRLHTAVLTCTSSLLMIGASGFAADSNAQENETPRTMNKVTVIEQADDADTTPIGDSSTATGLNLSVRETPQSVTVITQQQMKDQGMETVADVLRNATGVSITAIDTVRTEVSVRGFDVDSYQYDGVPVPTGNNVNHDLANTSIYDRVEIVRGATGLLNGVGEPSAAINLVRKHANSHSFAGSISAEVGRWIQALTVDLSAPLNQSGSVRGRVVASGSNQTSFIDWEKSKDHVLYGVLDIDLTAATQLSFGISHQAESRDNPMWYPLPIWYSDGSRTDWFRSKNTEANWGTWLTEENTAFLTLNQRIGNAWTLKASAAYQKNIDDEKLLWWDGYPDKSTGLGMVTAGYQWANISELNQISTVLSGPFQWWGRTHELNIGLLYSDFETRWDNIHDDPNAYSLEANFNDWNGAGYTEPAWGAGYLGAKDTTRQLAAYAVARFSLNDSLKLITGARVSNWHWRTQQAVWTPETLAVEKDDIFTPYVGIVYNVSKNVSTYASYTSIFKPQTNYRDRYGKYLDPLQGNSYELGVKGEWLDGYLHASAAVFYTDQDNFAIEDGNQTVPGTIDIQAYYAGQGINSKGYELELVGDLSTQWNVSANWTEYSAKDADDIDVAVDHPRRLFKLFSKYEFSNFLDGLRVGGGVNWQSRQLRRSVNPATGAEEAIGQSAYGLIDLMAGYAITSQLDVQLNVSNLLDKEYKSSSFWDAFTYGDPRNVRASLTYRFE